ncbi:hypothetical protein B4100_2045 [Heyndrickxia coagulans]|nr:hypothetical protein B4100_2045 [Heyndrickxia coagulans]
MLFGQNVPVTPPSDSLQAAFLSICFFGFRAVQDHDGRSFLLFSAKYSRYAPPAIL